MSPGLWSQPGGSGRTNRTGGPEAGGGGQASGRPRPEPGTVPRKSCPRSGFLTCTQGTSLLSALGPGGAGQGAHAWRPCSWARARRGRARRACARRPVGRARRPVGRARALRIRQHLLSPRPRRPAFLAQTSCRGSGPRCCAYSVRCEQRCGTPCGAAASRSLSVPGTVASGGRAQAARAPM